MKYKKVTTTFINKISFKTDNMAKKRQKRGSKSKKSSKKGKKGKISPKEHVKKISYDYKKRSKLFSFEKGKFRHPLGIKVLIAYLSVLLLFYFFYLFMGLKSPIAVVFGQIIGGLPALFLIMFLVLITMVLIGGLLKRKSWSYYLALVWFGLGIINSIISLILLRPEVASFTRNFLILSSITVLVIDILAILYIVSEKRYFFAHHFTQKKAMLVDKIFVTALIVFLIITITIGSALGYDFYQTNLEQADSIILELEGKAYEEQMEYCNSIDAQQRDLCVLIVSIKNSVKGLCSQIDSDFYKFSCLQA